VRSTPLGILGVLFVVTSSCRGPSSSAIPEARADEPAHGAAGDRSVVVELFTSEGCSSCPPADAVLADLASDRRVFALSLHVDYWDELGWPDPFSSPDNTARQRAYASSFRARGMYTPQLVVAGIDGFTGSDRGQAETDIATALSRPAIATLALKVQARDDGWITVETQPTGAPPGAVVNVALVQRSATTQVRAGENSGRTLRHVDVVRAFATATAAGAGAVRVKLPPGLRRQDAEIIAFVQASPAGGTGGMPILGAARADVGP
jgi:hypothetical protein